MNRSFNRILLIQLGDIGDVVLTLPAVRALRESYPQARIVVCVRDKAREIMEDCPWVSGVMAVESAHRRPMESAAHQLRWFMALRQHRFDLAIDLRTGTRGAIMARLSGAPIRIGRFAEDGRLWRNRMFTTLVQPENELMQYAAEHNLNILSPLHLHIENRCPQVGIPSHRRAAALALWSQEQIPSDKPTIAFHPFSLWKYKEWRMDACARVVDAIQLHYGAVAVITGSPDERDRAEQLAALCQTRPINLAGKTSIGELATVLSRCSGFIGVDTAALHLAAAAGIPTLGIFGPSSQACWAPRGDRHKVISSALPCVPCRQKGCQDSEISRCLDTLTFDDIQEKLRQFMADQVHVSM